MLPPFLKEVLDNCISEDDRDMMLMGTLTCISATLHNVVGEYNHDDWHPMLYFFVMADAGMGKGSLKYCREIVAPIHYELREASELLMKEYKESQIIMGNVVTVVGMNENYDGKVLDISSNGSLVIERMDEAHKGQIDELISGEVSIRRKG